MQKKGSSSGLLFSIVLEESLREPRERFLDGREVDEFRFQYVLLSGILLTSTGETGSGKPESSPTDPTTVKDRVEQ